MLGPWPPRRATLGKGARSSAVPGARGGGVGDLGAPAAGGPQPRGRGLAGHGHRTHQRRRVALPGHLPELRPGVYAPFVPIFRWLEPNLVTVRAVWLVGLAVLCVGSYWLARPFAPRWAAFGAGALPMLLRAPAHKTFVPLAYLATLWLASRLAVREHGPRGWWLSAPGSDRGARPSGGGRLRDADRLGDARPWPGVEAATRRRSRDARAVRASREAPAHSGCRRGVAPAADRLGGPGCARRRPAAAGAPGGAGERRHVAALPAPRAARSRSEPAHDVLVYLPAASVAAGAIMLLQAARRRDLSPETIVVAQWTGGRSPLPLDLPLPIRRPPPDPGAGRPGLAVGLCGGPPGALLPARSRRLRIRVGFAWRSRSWWRHRLPSFRSA